MNNEQLKILLQELLTCSVETEWVEFKENNFDPEEIGRLISALSNSANIHNKEAGYLVFGVDDKSHKIVGTTINPKRIKEGQEEVEHWLFQRLNPRLNVQIFSVDWNGHKVVIFEIPCAKDRPTYFKDIEYIRIGSITRNLIEFPELERMIWNNPLHRSIEKESSLSGVTKDRVLELIDYQEFLVLLGQPVLVDADAIVERLVSEKVLSVSRGCFNITNLGALLLARNFSDFESLKRKAIRIIIYQGNDRTHTIEERRSSRGYAVGFRGLVSYINSKLPTNEEIREALREEHKMYPEIAIRELVANALIHQDFSITGTGPMVEIFKDRLEIYNPGEPLINTTRFIDHSPRSRNEDLASQMRMMKICEERGSGIDKVVAAAEVYQLPAPKFDTYDNGTKVTLYSKQNFSQMDKLDKVRACYQHCCLNHVSSRDTTNTTVRKRFEISQKNYSIASRIIADTVDAGLIKSYDPDDTGSRKNAKYVPFWAG